MLTNYGLLTAADAELLGRMIDRVAGRFTTPTILEIGMREGLTSRAIQAHMGPRPFRFIAVESGRDGVPVRPPFDGAEVVHGDSCDSFERVSAPLHFVLIDGCHCVNHVILDFLHYGALVPSGGIVYFHDTGQRMQGKDYQGHGPVTPAYHVAVLMGIERLGLDRDSSQWEIEAMSDGEDWGGARAYVRR